MISRLEEKDYEKVRPLTRADETQLKLLIPRVWRWDRCTSKDRKKKERSRMLARSNISSPTYRQGEQEKQIRDFPHFRRPLKDLMRKMQN